MFHIYIMNMYIMAVLSRKFYVVSAAADVAKQCNFYGSIVILDPTQVSILSALNVCGCGQDV